MKKKVNLLTAVILAVMMFMSLTTTASAVDLATAKGSIEVTLKNDRGGGVQNVMLEAYQVAVGSIENNNLKFSLQDVLKSTGVELNGLSGSETGDAAKALAAAVKKMSSGDVAKIPSWSGTTDPLGMLKLSDLPVGVYLVVQKNFNVSYEDIDAFLLYLPMTSDDGTKWEYEMSAEPKLEVRASSDDEDEEIEIVIPDPEPPLGDIEEPDDLVDIGDEEPPLAMLPQTGLLQWPIPVMAVAGLLLFGAGWMSDKKARKAHED